MTLDWFDKISTFGALAIILAVLLYWIYKGLQFLGAKLFAEAELSKNYPGGLVTRWTDGQTKMMDTIEKSVVQQSDSMEKQADALVQQSLILTRMDEKVERMEDILSQTTDLLKAVNSSVTEVKHVVVKTDNVFITPKEKKSENNDPGSG